MAQPYSVAKWEAKLDKVLIHINIDFTWMINMKLFLLKNFGDSRISTDNWEYTVLNNIF